MFIFTVGDERYIHRVWKVFFTLLQAPQPTHLQHIFKKKTFDFKSVLLFHNSAHNFILQTLTQTAVQLPQIKWQSRKAREPSAQLWGHSQHVHKDTLRNQETPNSLSKLSYSDKVASKENLFQLLKITAKLCHQSLQRKLVFCRSFSHLSQ